MRKLNLLLFFGDKMTTKVVATKAEYYDFCDRILRFWAVKGRLPETVGLKSKTYSISEIKNALQRADVFYDKNKRLPNTLRVGTDSSTTTTVTTTWVDEAKYTWDEQDTAYWCFPASLVEALSSMGISGISESTIAGYAGTTHDGTTHDGAKAAVQKVSKKTGITLTYEEHYLSDIGYTGIQKAITDHNAGVIVHGKTGKNYWRNDYTGKLVWTNTYGHYCGVKAINPTQKLIKLADPTKGMVIYNYSEFEKGINGVQNQKSVIIVRRK